MGASLIENRLKENKEDNGLSSELRAAGDPAPGDPAAGDPAAGDPAPGVANEIWDVLSESRKESDSVRSKPRPVLQGVLNGDKRNTFPIHQQTIRRGFCPRPQINVSNSFDERILGIMDMAADHCCEVLRFSMINRAIHDFASKVPIQVTEFLGIVSDMHRVGTQLDPKSVKNLKETNKASATCRDVIESVTVGNEDMFIYGMG